MAKQFVCVRVQSMNGININRYAFEFDLTWMSFFQNHQGQTYLRYGGREDSAAESHLSKDSLIRAMIQTLKLHQDSGVQAKLAFNRYNPSGVPAKTPEQISGMQTMMAKRKVKCIHCHDVKSTQLRELDADGLLTKESVFTYPSPSNLGIHLDPVRQNRIKSIDAGSVAAVAGLQQGDAIQTMDGQPVYTYADTTRVLQLAPDEGSLSVVALRGDATVPAAIALGDRWRAVGDPSWRESTHVVGPNSGFWGVKQNSDQKVRLGLKDAQMAVKVTAIWGQWARNAGIKHGDIVINIDGRAEDMHIKQLQTYLQMKKDWGDRVPLTVLRGKKPIKLNLQLPAKPND